MFFICSLSDSIKIPPKMFGRPIRKSATEILQERYHSKIDPSIGFVIMVFDVTIEGRGLVSSTGGTVHKVEFSALAFNPRLHEIIKGEIVEMAEFGAFVRIGPTDAVLHLSQIAQDSLRVDIKSGTISSGRHGTPLRIGSRVTSRVSAVSAVKDGAMKIGLTCNEPDLGPMNGPGARLQDSGQSAPHLRHEPR